MKLLLSRHALVLIFVTFFAAVAAIHAAPDDGIPAAMPNARQYDLKSRINGQTYRIWVSSPFKTDPAIAYPVLYVLDGNVGFHIAAEVEAKMTFDREAAPAIIRRNWLPDRRFGGVGPAAGSGPDAMG